MIRFAQTCTITQRAKAFVEKEETVRVTVPPRFSDRTVEVPIHGLVIHNSCLR